MALDETAADRFAGYFRECWFRAVEHRQTLSAGGALTPQGDGVRNLTQMLVEAHWAYNSVPGEKERVAMEESGVRAKVSITKMKVDSAYAYLRRILADGWDAPFKVKAREYPDLRGDDYRDIAVMLLDELQAQGISAASLNEGQRLELVKALKERFREERGAEAQRRADNACAYIKDEMGKGGFRKEFDEFLFNLLLYPYAVMGGPFRESVEALNYDDDGNPESGSELIWRFKNIHPSDYFWSSDTKESGEGSYDIIRQQVSRAWVMRCLDLCKAGSGWQRAGIEGVLRNIEVISQYSWDWPFSAALSSIDTRFMNLAQRTESDSVIICRYFGRVRNDILHDMGIEGIKGKDWDVSEIEGIVCGEFTLYLRVKDNPELIGRPVYAISWQKQPGRPFGMGIAEILRDVERLYMSHIRNMTLAAQWRAWPITEVDARRLEAEIKKAGGNFRIYPGRTYFTESDGLAGMNKQPAIDTHYAPNDTMSWSQNASYFMALADQLTAIPSALNGAPMSGRVGRTFGGMSMLQNNSLMQIQSSVRWIDTMLEKILRNMFRRLMLSGESADDMRGDLDPVFNGYAGILDNQIKAQQAQGSIGLLGNLGSAGMIPQSMLRMAAERVLEGAGFTEEEIQGRMDEQALSQSAQPQGAAPGESPQPNAPAPGQPQPVQPQVS